jgi:hypothetical protein
VENVSNVPGQDAGFVQESARIGDSVEAVLMCWVINRAFTIAIEAAPSETY